MNTKEIISKSILSPSQIYEYTINPYTGCQHACSYCYAKFMKRFTGHTEVWGDFVDVKINAADLLRKEVIRKKPGTVWISGVCDPYQPLEEQYQLTRRILEILTMCQWPVVIQTRSPLILRDLDILKKMKHLEAGFSITTADEDVRKIFEPNAPSIQERIGALKILHEAGIRTYAMIAPMLPKAEGLIDLLDGKVDYLLIDKMNYGSADRIYKSHGWMDQKTPGYFRETANRMAKVCRERGILYKIVFNE